jgi:hypothetical protein
LLGRDLGWVDLAKGVVEDVVECREVVTTLLYVVQLGKAIEGLGLVGVSATNGSDNCIHAVKRLSATILLWLMVCSSWKRKLETS